LAALRECLGQRLLQLFSQPPMKRLTPQLKPRLTPKRPRQLRSQRPMPRAGRLESVEGALQQLMPPGLRICFP
jgi:hypothetical protein